MTEIKVESDVTGTAWKIVVIEGQAVEGEVLFLMDV
jgi:biotin carboxyl carrier protein